MVVSIAKSSILTGRKRAHEWYIWKNYNQVCLAKIGVQRIVESTIVVYIARPASLNDLASEECLIQGGEITRRKKTWNGFVSRKSMIIIAPPGVPTIPSPRRGRDTAYQGPCKETPLTARAQGPFDGGEITLGLTRRRHILGLAVINIIRLEWQQGSSDAHFRATNIHSSHTPILVERRI